MVQGWSIHDSKVAPFVVLNIQETGPSSCVAYQQLSQSKLDMQLRNHVWDNDMKGLIGLPGNGERVQV